MILLDTTVLVYALGTDHELRGPARDLLAAIADRRIAASTTVEVIQEFTHVRARRRSRGDAVALARDLTTLLAPLTPVIPSDLSAGLDLYETHDGLGCFDAVLAATTRRLGAKLVSADRSFVPVLGNAHLDLAGPALEDLLTH